MSLMKYQKFDFINIPIKFWFLNQRDWKCIQSFTRVNQGFLMQTWLPVCHYKTLQVQTTSLPAYARKFLPPRWSPDNMDNGLRPDNSATALHAYLLPGCSGWFSNGIQALCSHLQWQDTKLHACPCCCPAAVAGYQTACTNARCCPAAVTEYQTACVRGYPAAVAGSQTHGRGLV
jgi:hypothetical protein